MLKARIYRIARGQVRELPLEEGRPVEIAVDIDDGYGPGLVRADVRPGRCELPLWPVEILPLAMAAVERMAPWATVYAAPTWLSPSGDEYTFWGQARRNSDAVLLTTSAWGVKALDTLHHELWHVLEQYLLPSEWAAVVEACSSGPAWVDQRYYATPTERAARAFAAWCVARVEAPTPPVTGWRAGVRRWAMSPHERVFQGAFDGTIARRALARREVATARLSEASRARSEASRAAMSVAASRRHPKALVPA
jgi:hypothetical protein